MYRCGAMRSHDRVVARVRDESERSVSKVESLPTRHEANVATAVEVVWRRITDHTAAGATRVDSVGVQQ